MVPWKWPRENEKLQIAKGITLAENLLQELSNFKVTVSANGYNSYEAAKGHDDLVIAVGLAAWRGV